MLLIEKKSIFERENLSAINRMKILLEEGRNFYLFINDKISYDYVMNLLSAENIAWGSDMPLTHPNRSFEWYQKYDERILEVSISSYNILSYKVWVTKYTRMKDWEQIHFV